MIQLIKPKGQPEEKPVATTLENKVSGFKFNTPKINAGRNTAIPAVVETPAAPEPDKPNGNKLLIGGNKQASATANTVHKPADPIPEMSLDKYEVVIGAKPEISEESGNKFRQQLEMLQSAIDGNGVLKDQMENILTFLDDNPEYKENVAPKDVAVFVAACRKVAGITVTEKVERKTRQTKTSAAVQDVLDDLADLTFDI